MKRTASTMLLALFTITLVMSAGAAPPPPIDTARGDKMIAEYFRLETAGLRDRCLADVKSLEDWKAKRQTYRKQLLEMLGLDPLPERTDLKATITGRVDHEQFTVEKLHFQSRPKLYVTANLYVPKGLKKPAPAILYVCGHGGVKKNGVIYGNKVHYQHHGAWFARHGYVCLTIDTLQLGEIEGIHHGTYLAKYAMWWWNSRGYTPAGVEAWNCMRALDYLQSRKEIDPGRIGVTGRSGGGAYSWWIAATDERIKVAVPVAGTTDLENHVVTGCVEGHCDCMYMVNTYRWDYPMVAALVAPRPLLLSNTDRDGIFPLDGVVRTYNQVRKIYELYGAREKLGLLITAGPHKDTQQLRVPAFHWFNKYLKGEDPPIDVPAEKLFTPEQLKVFKDLPADSVNAEIQETFTVAAAPAKVPGSMAEWAKARDGWRKALLEKSFRGWPKQAGPLDVKRAFSAGRQGLRLNAYDFTSQTPVRLRLYLVEPVGLAKPQAVVLNVLDQQGWGEFLASMRPVFETELKEETPVKPDRKTFEKCRDWLEARKCAAVFLAPRGIGPTAWNQAERKQTHHRRRFMLLGQTLDGMRVWDVRRAVQAIRSLDVVKGVPLVLESKRKLAGVTLYASLFEPDIAQLELDDLPPSHRQGPILLNVSRYLDMPEAVAMAAERSPVTIGQADLTGWEYPAAVAKKLGWGDKRLTVRKSPAK